MTDEADKELSQLAGPTAPQELSAYVSSLQNKNIVYMRILSMRWSLASRCRGCYSGSSEQSERSPSCFVVIGWLLGLGGSAARSGRSGAEIMATIRPRGDLGV